MTFVCADGPSAGDDDVAVTRMVDGGGDGESEGNEDGRERDDN